LEIGDRIVTIDGKKVDDVMMMKQVLNQFIAGQEAELGYYPYEKKDLKTVKVTLGIPPLPKGELPPFEPPEIR
jgi:C-terminal processing protease CtpA/Prc